MCDDCLYYKEVLTKTRRELSELKDQIDNLNTDLEKQYA